MQWGLSSYHSRCFYPDYEADATQLESGYLKGILLVKVCQLTLSDHILYLLVLQVYKAIFTSPSSAKDVSEEDNNENTPPAAKAQKILSSDKPVRRNVASKLHLNCKVTPRSIAYAAVQVWLSLLWHSPLICDLQLHFNLQTAGSWSPIYGGFDYQGLYNYIVDVFEDTPGPVSKKRAQGLLNWWSMWVFPLRPRHIWLIVTKRKIFPTASLHRRSNTSASRKAFKRQRAALKEEGAWALS
jgi:hypothetical protein